MPRHEHRLGSVVLSSCAALFLAGAALAQTGGGGGGSGGASGSAGSGAGAGTAGPGGAGPSTGTPGTGPGSSLPSGQPAPQGLPGPQSRSPATVPSTVPQRQTGVPPVPSAGNAEPTSPIYRRDRQPGTGDAQRDPTAPVERAPRQDSTIGGSGHPAGRSGAAGPGEADSDNLDVSKTRDANSISEEPDRVRRQGGAAGRTLDECMQNWDAGTHMTREQWKVTCERLSR